MPTTEDFAFVAQWSWIATASFAVLALLAFLFKWRFRFNLVGVTGFMVVLSVGLFTLSLIPFTRTTIEGAAPFSVVYDNGSTQAVIAVSPDITESELDLTLQQAASNLYSYGRLGLGDAKLTIRARTIVHPNDSVSKPVYLGQVKRSLSEREDENMEITIDSEKFDQIRQTS